MGTCTKTHLHQEAVWRCCAPCCTRKLKLQETVWRCCTPCCTRKLKLQKTLWRCSTSSASKNQPTGNGGALYSQRQPGDVMALNPLHQEAQTTGDVTGAPGSCIPPGRKPQRKPQLSQ